jgi:hypothetical protein
MELGEKRQGQGVRGSDRFVQSQGRRKSLWLPEKQRGVNKVTAPVSSCIQL